MAFLAVRLTAHLHRLCLANCPLYTMPMKLQFRLTRSGFVLVFAATAATLCAQAPSDQSSDEAGAAAVFNRVAGDQSRLRVFLQAMPKGANLHNHLDGSVYIESYVKMA